MGIDSQSDQSLSDCLCIRGHRKWWSRARTVCFILDTLTFFSLEFYVKNSYKFIHRMSIYFLLSSIIVNILSYLH
jgi:uncharacterized PurR-regulated membrane protein YhhQ (DUF165 family)